MRATSEATSVPLAKRSAGLAARHCFASAISSGSAPLASSRANASAVSARAAICRVDSESLPTNTALPVRIAQRIAPRPKTSDALADLVDGADRLFRRHVGGGAEDGAGGGFGIVGRIRVADLRAEIRDRVGVVSSESGGSTPPARQNLREAPVHHLHFAERADHHVERLQVAVDDAAAVGVADGVADVFEDGDEVRRVRVRVLDVVGERAALHELHREERLVLP